MKTQAAILWDTKQPWQVEEVELAEPLAGEVRLFRTLPPVAVSKPNHN